MDTDAGPAMYLIAPDGSALVMAHRRNPHGGRECREAGPTRLLAAVERAWTESAQAGHPPVAEFGRTLTPGSARLWHGGPSDGPSWAFP